MEIRDPKKIMQEGLVQILEDPSILERFERRRIGRMDIGHANYGTFYLRYSADGQPSLVYAREGEAVNLGDIKEGPENLGFERILSGFGRDYRPSTGTLDSVEANRIVEGMRHDIEGHLNVVRPMWTGELSEDRRQLIEAVDELYSNSQLREVMARYGSLRISLVGDQPFFEFGITEATTSEDLRRKLDTEAAFLFVDVGSIGSKIAYIQIGVKPPLGPEDINAAAANIYGRAKRYVPGRVYDENITDAEALRARINWRYEFMKGQTMRSKR